MLQSYVYTVISEVLTIYIYVLYSYFPSVEVAVIIFSITFVCLFFRFVFQNRASLCTAPAVLVLILQTRLALNSQRYVCLCLTSIGIRGVDHNLCLHFLYSYEPRVSPGGSSFFLVPFEAVGRRGMAGVGIDPRRYLGLLYNNKKFTYSKSKTLCCSS